MQLCKLAAGTIVAVVVTASQAYQTDFHFGMTYWLAQRAGLTPEESLVVASGNEWKDKGMYDARPIVAYSICVKKDPFAFKAMREHHFRASREYPAPPDARKVAPGTDYASEDVEKLLGRTWTEGQRQNGLVDFGGALHGFQDTYSHKGESQVPIHCDPTLAWTHPKDRNGNTDPWPNYLSTNADLTYLWPKDCAIAARESYQYLRRFTEKMFPARTLGSEWNAELATHVDAFCKAETKSAKVDWFKSHGVPQELAIAQSTTLDDGKGSYKYLFGRSVQLSGFVLSKGPVSEGAQNLARDMENLARKIEKSNATPQERALLERYLRLLVNSPANALPEDLAVPFGRTGQVPADDPSLRATQRLRFVDRGLAARNPMPLADLASPETDIATVPGRTAGWQSMYVTPLGQQYEQPYVLGSDNGSLVAFALLHHAPYEVLRVTISREDKSPRIVRVDILAMH